MKIEVVPQTKLGKWSVYLLAVFVVLFSVSLVLVMMSDEREAGMGDLSWDRFYLAIPIILAWASMIAAGITGLISIIKQKEKAILVYLSTFLGLATIVLFVLEFTVLE